MRALLQSKSVGPEITPTRRCPSSMRCRVAVKPPDQLVAPTVVTLGSGSPRGSTTAKGRPRARNSACSRCPRRASNKMIPRVPLALMWSSQDLSSTPSESDVSATFRPVSEAAATAPRTISIAHGLSSSAKTRSTRGGAPVREVRPALVPPVKQQGLYALAGSGGNVRVPVEHLRNRRDGDPGRFGDLSNRDAISHALVIITERPKCFGALRRANKRRVDGLEVLCQNDFAFERFIMLSKCFDDCPCGANPRQWSEHQGALGRSESGIGSPRYGGRRT